MITIKTAKKYSKTRGKANKDLDEYVVSFNKHFKEEKYTYYEILCMVESHVKAFDKKQNASGILPLLLSFLSAVFASLFTSYFLNQSNPDSAINLIASFSHLPVLANVFYTVILGFGIGVLLLPFYIMWSKWDGGLRDDIYKREILLNIIEEKKEVYGKKEQYKIK